MKAKEFGETLAAQHRGFSFSVYSQYCNLTAWVEGSVVYILQITIIMGIIKNTYQPKFMTRKRSSIMVFERYTVLSSSNERYS